MRRALLVLDFNNDIVNAKGRFGSSHGLAAVAAERDLSSNVALAIAAARSARDVVVWAYPGPNLFASMGMEPSDEWGATFDPDYGTPAPDEPVYAKDGRSAFAGSSMPDDLRGRDVDTLLLAGVTTSIVVALTAADAIELGFAVTVLEDCCSDASVAAHDAALAALPSGVQVATQRSVWGSVG